MTGETCTCGAKSEHMGEGRYGKFHRQDCPMFDGDHPEIVPDPESRCSHRVPMGKGCLKCKADRELHNHAV